MTAGIPDRRRRNSVSLSLPDVGATPVDQLSRVVEALRRVNRMLPTTVIGRDELLALGGRLTQISDALLTLTDLLSPSAHRLDRANLRRAYPDTIPAERRPTVASLLRDCRDGYLAAYNSAQALHADLRRGSEDPRTPRQRRR